jgi:hypothetical protein
VLLICLFALSTPSCGAHHRGKYLNAVEANRANVQSLRLGMNASELDSAMGRGELVHYRAIRLANPWRSEAFRLEDGTNVAILYYVTERQHRYRIAADEELTPVILENDVLVGWGWSFVNRNLERYQVRSKAVQ